MTVRAKSRWERLSRGALSAVLLIAAVGKLLDLEAFAASLESWQLLPVWVRGPAAPLIPIVEAGTAIGLWSAWRTTAKLVCVAFASALVVTTALHLRANLKPTCDCFGLLMKWAENGQTLRASVGASGALLVLSLAGVALDSWASQAPAADMPPRAVTASVATPSGSSGFTLVEMLVACVVIGALLALALPGLAAARVAVRSAKTRSNLRSCAQIVGLYQSDWRGSFPAYLDPQSRSASVRWSMADAPIDVGPYFAGARFWHVALADAYFGGVPDPVSICDARDTRDLRPFEYPCVFLARPEYWDLSTREGRNQLGSVTDADVRFPSAKALFLSEYAFTHSVDGSPRGAIHPAIQAQIELVAVDGHAMGVPSQSISHGIRTGDGLDRSLIYHPLDLPLGLHTSGGVRGRDFK